MERIINGRTIRLMRGDITRAGSDGIVNAANAHLAGGGGVDGAIHRAAGPRLADECRRIGGCPTGQAVATTAGNLDAQYVIHAVAPRWQGGGRGEVDLLRSAYRRSLVVADELGLQSIAFPSLGTGIYGNPLQQSAQIALAAVAEYLQSDTGIYEVIFYLFSDRDLQVYERTLETITQT
jgi:O-acetyl-ADP-ribose deacetylase